MKELQMGKEPIHNLLLKSAAPAVIGMLLQSIYVMIDGMFVGQGTGPLGLAAVNLSMPVLQVGSALAFMLVIGGSTYTAIALGESDTDKASTTFSMVLKTLLLVSVAFTIIGVLGAERIATVAGADVQTHTMVSGYIRILSISMPFFMLTMLLETGMRVVGQPMKSMVVLSFGALLNVGLDWLLIMKLNMGVNGAAIATGISQLISMLVLLRYYLKPGFILKLKNAPISMKVLRPILFNGSSEFATGIALGISTYLFNLILMSIKGNMAVSAYSIIGYISQIVFMIHFGLAAGMQPIVSFNYGAKNTQRYKDTLKLALVVASGVGILASITLLTAAEPITKLFIGNRLDLLDLTLTASTFAALIYVPAGINIIMSGYYTAIDRPVESVTIAIFRSLIFIVVGLFTLPNLFGLSGVWATMPGAEILTLLICGGIVQYHKSKEKNPKAPMPIPSKSAA